MGASNDKLRKLLDGELDLSEVSDDPILASLAEKIYGIELSEIKAEPEGAGEDAPMLGFELHMSGSPEAKELSLPELPLPDLPEPTAKKGRKAPRMMRLSSVGAMFLGPAITAAAAMNIEGRLGFLKSCSTIESNQGVCDATRERINWLAPTRLGHSDGWLETGGFGIPTIGLIVLGLLMLIFGFQGWRFLRSQ